MTTDMTFSLFWEDAPALWDTVLLGDEDLPGLARVTGSHGRKLDVKSPPGRNGATITDKGYQPAKVEITLKLWTKEQLETWFRIAPTLTYRREPPRRVAGASQKQGDARALELADGQRERMAQLAAGLTAPGQQKELQRKSELFERETQPTENRSGRARSLERHDFTISHPALDTIQVHRVYIEEVGVPTPTGEPGVYEVKIKAVESKASTNRGTRSVGSAASSRASTSPAVEAVWTPPPSRSGGAGP